VRRLLPALLILTTLTTPALAQDGGRLDAVRDQVRGTKDQHDDNSHHDKHHDGPGDDDDDEALGQVYLMLLISPWMLPHHALHDSFRNDSFFRPYPYADGCGGALWINPDRCDHPPTLPKEQADTLKSWMVRLTLDDSDDFDGLNRIHGQLLIDTASRFGLQTDWWYLIERMPCGCVDTMMLGDVNLVFRFAECEWMQMRSGLGLRMQFDRGDSHFGFNFTYSADVFPVDPLVASFQFDAGTLGSATVLHGRATVGATWHGWEVFGGYDWLRIGNVDLSGPMLGLRLWF
jgi:hypothetical protein